MSCQCGSQKQSGAVEFLNPVDIGVLCSLFGAEGVLCRLLDVVPAAIKKIASLNPDLENADQVFGDILKKVAKKGFSIVIDEVTGQIDVSDFCAKSPPPLPDDITYQDIYQFIAELVPILNYFFTVNDILQGNSTKLLDKIVGFWLYQKWYENCECVPCPPDTPPPPPPPPVLFPKCPLGYSRERASNDFGIIKKNYLGQVILYNNVFVFETEFVITEINGTKFVAPPKAGYADGEGYWTYSPSVWVIKEDDPTDSYNTVNGVRVAKGKLPSYVIPPCIPIPPPPPPPEFCDLFPDDPLCPQYGCTDPLASNYNPNANTDDGSCIYPVYGCTNPNAINYNPDATIDDGSCSFDCNSVDVTVVEFGGCNSDRQTKQVSLYDLGGVIDVTVVEFGGCNSDRQTKQVSLYDCTPINEIFGCTDPLASNYNPNALVDDGSCIYAPNCDSFQEQYTTWGTNDANYFLGAGWDMVYAYQMKYTELQSSETYQSNPDCIDSFNQWYTDAWNAVINT